MVMSGLWCLHDVVWIIVFTYGDVGIIVFNYGDVVGIMVFT